MIEFSNLIKVSLLGNLKGDFQFMADTFTFEPSPTEGNGGTYWDCTKTFVVDKPDDEALSKFKIPRSAIVTLSNLYRGRTELVPRLYRIGTSEVPARVQITQHLDKASLIVRCKMLSDPLA